MNWDNHFFTLDAAWEYIEKSSCLSKRYWILPGRNIDVPILDLMFQSSLLVSEHLNRLNTHHVDGVFLLALHRVLEDRNLNMATQIRSYLGAVDYELLSSLHVWKSTGEWTYHLQDRGEYDLDQEDNYITYGSRPIDQWLYQHIPENKTSVFKAEKKKWLQTTSLSEWIEQFDWKDRQDFQVVISCIYDDMPDDKKKYLYNAPLFKESILYLIVQQSVQGVDNLVLEDTAWYGRKSGHQICTLLDVFKHDLTDDERVFVQQQKRLPFPLLEKWARTLYSGIDISLEDLRHRAELANSIGFDDTNHPLREWSSIKDVLFGHHVEHLKSPTIREIPISDLGS